MLWGLEQLKQADDTAQNMYQDVLCLQEPPTVVVAQRLSV